MTVEELKEKLQDILDNLENYDDEEEISMVSNTYFLGNPRLFLGIAGYDGGYINLDNPVEEWDGLITKEDIMKHSNLCESEAEELEEIINADDYYTDGYSSKKDFFNDNDLEQILKDYKNV